MTRDGRAVFSENQLEGIFAAKVFGRIPDFRELRFDPLIEVLRGFSGHIVMVRHGPTIYSEKGEFAGGVHQETAEALVKRPDDFDELRENIELSKRGVGLTEAYAKSVEGKLLRRFSEASAVYVSPLRRTRQTVDILLGASTRWMLQAGLNELFLSDDFGMPSSEDTRNKLNNAEYEPKGGETNSDYAERVVLTLVDLIGEAKSTNKDLVIVGHGHWIPIALGALVALSDGNVRSSIGIETISPCKPIMVTPSQNDGKREIFDFPLGLIAPKSTPKPRKALSNKHFLGGLDASDDPVRRSTCAKSSRIFRNRSVLQLHFR